MKVLIDASNLHVGGGVQVAVSFLSELFQDGSIDLNGIRIDVVASSVVNNELERVCDIGACRFGYKVADRFGMQLLFDPRNRLLRQYDCVFTVFGPLYSIIQPRISIVGFANPYFGEDAIRALERAPWYVRYPLRLSTWAKGVFFKRADLIIVEEEHVRQTVVQKTLAKRENVFVVRNTASNVFKEPESWMDLNGVTVTKGDRLLLGYVGRNYWHKNTKIFPKIKSELLNKYGIDAEFVVTFTRQEWADCSSEFRKSVINVGPISVVQCPKFYELVDFVILPSYLECSSVMPLEAMMMKRPVLVSDRQFNHATCQGFAIYFDPNDPSSAARVIARAWKEGIDESFLTAASEYATKYSTASVRAREYLEVIRLALYGIR